MAPQKLSAQRIREVQKVLSSYTPTDPGTDLSLLSSLAKAVLNSVDVRDIRRITSEDLVRQYESLLATIKQRSSGEICVALREQDGRCVIESCMEDQPFLVSSVRAWLAAEGLLTQRPHRGFQVLPVTGRDIADVADVQAYIGGELASRAAELMTDDEIDRLSKVQDRLEESYLADDPDRAVALNHEFHRDINRAAKSPKLAQLMSQTTRYALESVYPTVRGWPEQSNHDHRRVLAALRAQPKPWQLTPTELYRALLLSSGGLTKILYRLKEAGWIDRPANPEDGRSKLVRLSRAGTRQLDKALQVIFEHEDHKLDVLSAKEQQELGRLLGKLVGEWEKNRLQSADSVDLGPASKQES